MTKGIGHIVFGLLSFAALSSMIFYFLKNEYKDEEQRIRTESRNEIFVSLITDLQEGTAPVKWVKDDSTNTGFKMIFVEEQDESFEGEFTASYSIEHRDDYGAAKISRFSTDTMRYEDEHIFESIQIAVESNMDSLRSEMGFRNFPDRLFDREAEKKIEPKEVLKGIAPQIGLSSLVLLTVALTYFFLWRQLIKERQLSELRNEFVSNMSHELKTPVSTISVALEALKNFNAAGNKEMREEYLDITTKEIDRLGLLVDKALNISLFEQDKFVLDKQKLDIKEEVQNVLDIMKVQFQNRQAHVDFQSVGDDFMISADKTHIINVIHNLLENGIKYSGNNPVISVLLKSSGKEISLEVKDNGIGIPEAYQSKIFDKFFRVPQGNKHNTKGHGLGLSYVKQVIDNHNGTIEVNSKSGLGTSFIITLPKIAAHA